MRTANLVAIVAAAAAAVSLPVAADAAASLTSRNLCWEASLVTPNATWGATYSFTDQGFAYVVCTTGNDHFGTAVLRAPLDGFANSTIEKLVFPERSYGFGSPLFAVVVDQTDSAGGRHLLVDEWIYGGSAWTLVSLGLFQIEASTEYAGLLNFPSNYYAVAGRPDVIMVGLFNEFRPFQWTTASYLDNATASFTFGGGGSRVRYPIDGMAAFAADGSANFVGAAFARTSVGPDTDSYYSLVVESAAANATTPVVLYLSVLGTIGEPYGVSHLGGKFVLASQLNDTAGNLRLVRTEYDFSGTSPSQVNTTYPILTLANGTANDRALAAGSFFQGADGSAFVATSTNVARYPPGADGTTAPITVSMTGNNTIADLEDTTPTFPRVSGTYYVSLCGVLVDGFNGGLNQTVCVFDLSG